MALTTNPMYRFSAKEYHRLITTYEFNDVSDALKYVEAYYVINQESSLPSFIDVLTRYGGPSVGYYRVPFTTYIYRHFEFLRAKILVRCLQSHRRRSQNYTAFLREIKAYRLQRERTYPSCIRRLSSQPITQYTQKEQNSRQYEYNGFGKGASNDGMSQFICSRGMFQLIYYGAKDIDNNFNNDYEEKQSMKRIHERTRIIKEELMMNVWHPDRVGTLIIKHGLEVLEML